MLPSTKKRPVRFVADVVSRRDPTGTTDVRRAWEGEAVQRINTAGRKIKAALVQHDALGLKRDSVPMGPFSVGTPASRAKLFGEWVYQALVGEILGQWQNKHINKAYRKGLSDAAVKIRKVDQSFKTPILVTDARIANEDRAALIYLRSYTELEGVTDAMASQMQSIIANGMAEGDSPMQIARDLDTVLEIGRTRSRVIARTETISAHAEASLNAYEEAGFDEVVAEVEFTTAGDDHVCPKCQALEGQRYSIEEAHGVIPVHPQCRCSWQPVPKDEVSIGDDLRDWNPFQPRVPAGSSTGGEWTEGASGGATGSLAGSFGKKGLTAEHKATLRVYAGADYYPINQGLRAKNQLSQIEQQTVNKLDEAFKLAMRTSEIKLVYRAAGAEFESAMNGVDVGDVITDHGYVSTTEDEQFARRLLGGGMGHTSMLEIVVPKNVPAIDMKPYNALKEENEYLLPRGSTFKYLGKEGDKHRFRYNAPAWAADAWIVDAWNEQDHPRGEGGRFMGVEGAQLPVASEETQRKVRAAQYAWLEKNQPGFVGTGKPFGSKEQQKLLPLKELPTEVLVATQSFVNPARVEMRVGKKTQAPIAVKMGKNYYITQGHHRTLAAIKSGATTHKFRVMDAYNPEQPRAPAGSSAGGEWTREGMLAARATRMAEVARTRKERAEGDLGARLKRAREAAVDKARRMSSTALHKAAEFVRSEENRAEGLGMLSSFLSGQVTGADIATREMVHNMVAEFALNLKTHTAAARAEARKVLDKAIELRRGLTGDAKPKRKPKKDEVLELLLALRSALDEITEGDA